MIQARVNPSVNATHVEGLDGLADVAGEYLRCGDHLRQVYRGYICLQMNVSRMGRTLGYPLYTCRDPIHLPPNECDSNGANLGGRRAGDRSLGGM